MEDKFHKQSKNVEEWSSTAKGNIHEENNNDEGKKNRRTPMLDASGEPMNP